MAKTAVKAEKRTSKRRSKTIPLTSPPPNLNRLLSLRHNDPHQILGVHQEGDAHVFRAFRPDAQSVEVIIGKTRARQMSKSHESGLFELSVENLTEPLSYKYRIRNFNGDEWTIRDPYSFLPTVGELDLHLFGEGKHEEIYRNSVPT